MTQIVEDTRHEDILNELLKLGEAMILSGIEISKVELCLFYVGESFGAKRTDILISSAGMVGTMIFPDGERVTQSRRIAENIGVNCVKAERLEALVYDCYYSPMSIDEFSKRLKACSAYKEPLWIIILGGVLAMMSFTVLFGGYLEEALVAGVIGLFVVFAKDKLQRYMPNVLVFNVACSFVVGLAVCLICYAIPALQMDKIMTGALLLMIPGLAFTHATRDVFMGETAIGAMHFIETVLWAGGLAFGFSLAMFYTGVYANMVLGAGKDTLSIVVCLIAAFTGSLGFGLMFRLPKRFLFLTPLCGLLAFSIKLFVGMATGLTFTPSFLAGCFVAGFAALMSRKFDTTPMAFAVPGIMPCIPGSLMFYTMSCAVAQDAAGCELYATQMIEVAIALSAGLCIVWAIEATIYKILLVRAADREEKSKAQEEEQNLSAIQEQTLAQEKVLESGEVQEQVAAQKQELDQVQEQPAK